MTDSIYKKITTNKPPEWVHDAGSRAYKGITNAFELMTKKKKKGKTIDERQAEEDKKRNALRKL